MGSSANSTLSPAMLPQLSSYAFDYGQKYFGVRYMSSSFLFLSIVDDRL